MRLERLTSDTHPKFSMAFALYEDSFPHLERRDLDLQIKILSSENHFFNLIFDKMKFVGILLTWEKDDFTYIEHFAISKEMRNCSYGKKTLELLKKSGRTIILEIDPPLDEISIRRKRFYERCGFKFNPFSHTHPPYRMGEKGHPLKVMSFPNLLTEDKFEEFKSYIENEVVKHI